MTGRCSPGPATGVAVANADDAVKDIADAVTGSNDEDGVAQVLERVIR
jgi:hydroxymethylpyrimidine pyrophosphatase-like HAD family hydrolase